MRSRPADERLKVSESYRAMSNGWPGLDAA